MDYLCTAENANLSALFGTDGLALLLRSIFGTNASGDWKNRFVSLRIECFLEIEVLLRIAGVVVIRIATSDLRPQVFQRP
jgi:hypothetical protein